MNRLSITKRVQAISALIEGVSIDATCRMTGVAKQWMRCRCLLSSVRQKTFVSAVCRRTKYGHSAGAKARNVTLEQKATGWGDVWTWVAIDADTKLIVSYLVGQRSTGWAVDFMEDCRERIIGNPQITTDAHKPYLKAVKEAFGGNANYAMLHKIYGASDEPKKKQSPATCIGCVMKTVSGVPDPDHVSTSYVERSKLSMPMSMRRFTRLTNTFSKKVKNHETMLAVYLMHYNYCRIHQTLRVTPAMESELANRVWSINDLVGLMSN